MYTKAQAQMEIAKLVENFKVSLDNHPYQGPSSAKP
jgi:hypothetical protein